MIFFKNVFDAIIIFYQLLLIYNVITWILLQTSKFGKTPKLDCDSNKKGLFYIIYGTIFVCHKEVKIVILIQYGSKKNGKLVLTTELWWRIYLVQNCTVSL